jgi:zinc protease
MKKNIHEYVLKNGLKLIVKEDHRAPVAIMQVWYKVGSSYESNGSTGISHALEHMMFRGSRNYRGSQYDQIMAEHGGQHNAFTAQDFTVYYQLMASDKLEVCFKLEADRMCSLSLSEKDFKKEITVVMEERYMSLEDNPDRRAYERFSAVAHIASPYRHSIIGWMDDLKHLNIEDLRQWYQTWYAPNNAVIVVIGGALPETIYRWTKKYFGFIRSRPISAVKPQNEVISLGKRDVTVKVPAKLPSLWLGYNTPVLNTVTKDKKWEPYALTVLSGLLGMNNSSRLQKNLVRHQQVATSAWSHYSPFDRLDNLFELGLVPSGTHTVLEAKQALDKEIETLRNDVPTGQELNQVKVAWLAGKTFGKDSLFNQAHEIGMLECIGQSWRDGGDLMVKKILLVTPEQVKEVALKYLTPERLTVGVLEPLSMEQK